MRKEKISYFRALFTLPLLFAFGLLGILLGTTCNGCDPCCPEITEFRTEPTEVCSPGGEVTLFYRVEFRHADGERCSPGTRHPQIVFQDRNSVGGRDRSDWADTGRTILQGVREGIRIEEGHNQISLTISGKGECENAYDETTVYIVDCSIPVDPDDPNGSDDQTHGRK